MDNYLVYNKCFLKLYETMKFHVKINRELVLFCIGKIAFFDVAEKQFQVTKKRRYIYRAK